MKHHPKRTALLAIAAGFAVFFLGGCAMVQAEKDYYESLSVADPDLARIGDGKYWGECTLHPPIGVIVAQNRVELYVVIANHAYADIVVETKTLKDNDHLKKMRRLVIENQTLQLDAMSGPTSLTGKAYLRAIADALD